MMLKDICRYLPAWTHSIMGVVCIIEYQKRQYSQCPFSESAWLIFKHDFT